jgi:hypothetical protein
MALSGDGSSGIEVSHGSDASFTHSGILTLCAWVLPPVTIDNGYFISNWHTTNSLDAGFLYIYAAGDVAAGIERATSPCRARTATGFMTSNEWQFIAARLNTSGADGDQEIYRGTLTTEATEAGSYTQQQVGLGTVQTSGDDLTTFNRNDNIADWSRLNGTIAMVAIYPSYLNTGQIIEQQWKLLPVTTSQLFCNYLNGTSLQPDWSGNKNNGTPTGLSEAAHVPVPIFPYEVNFSLQGVWINESGQVTNLYQSIDEVTPNDNDYIASPSSPDGEYYECTLENVFDPGTNENHKVRYRYKKTGSAIINLNVELRQGATQIASWNHGNIPNTITQVEQVLTSGQGSLITDYNDLRLRFVASGA